MNREDNGQTERPDSEVKTPYRRFSAKEKLRILEEADMCTEPGEIGALLRREGIYSLYTILLGIHSYVNNHRTGLRKSGAPVTMASSSA